jgi:hypothetical protein
VQEIRTSLEAKYRIRIPLIVQLKGDSIRVGKLETYTVKLTKGTIFRFFHTKKIVGNEKGCYCGFGEWFNRLLPNDLISINSGRHFFKVLEKDTVENGLAQINYTGDAGKFTSNLNSEEGALITPPSRPLRRIRKQSELLRDNEKSDKEEKLNRSLERVPGDIPMTSSKLKLEMKRLSLVKDEVETSDAGL